MDKVRRDWRDFLVMLASPYALGSIVITTLLYCISAQQQEKLLISTFSVLGSLFLSVACSIWYKRWLDINERSLLVARGVSAIRNLGQLMNQVDALKKRVETYLARCSGEGQDQSSQLVQVYFEETVEKCSIIGKAVIDAIENWTDVIPEANINEQVGTISALHTELAALTSRYNELAREKDQVMEEMEAARRSSSQESRELRQKLAELNAELDKTKAQLKDTQGKLHESRKPFDTGVLSGISGSINLLSDYQPGLIISRATPSLMRDDLLVLGAHTCIECGKEYRASSASTLRGRCPECAKKQ